MAPPARAFLAFAPLLLGVGALLASGPLGAHVAPADLPLWRLLALQFCWVGLAVATAHMLGGSPVARLGLGASRLSGASVAFGALGLLALSGALEFAIQALGLRSGGTLARLDAMVEEARAQSPLLAFLATALAPGIGEELLFRGLLQRSLAARFGAWAIPLAALAFGLLHQDPVHSPAAFAMGCYLGAVAFLTGSTWAAVACHVANNAVATLQHLFSLPLPAPGAAAEACAWLIASAACLGALAWTRRTPRADESSG